jgi:biopolymer transport protein ExbB
MADGSMTLGQLLAQAGWTMAPLYVCSVAALALGIKKLRDLRAARIDDDAPLEAIPADLDEEGLAALEAKLASAGTPLGRVVLATARTARTRPDRAEEAGTRAAVAELEVLENGLGALAFIAQAAPLFGLLGTVIGMVELFSSMEAAGDAVDTTTLSSGIWKALLTTAAGLIVAIPTMGAHAWLGARVDRLRLRMDEGIGRVLDRRVEADG